MSGYIRVGLSPFVNFERTADGAETTKECKRAERAFSEYKASLKDEKLIEYFILLIGISGILLATVYADCGVYELPSLAAFPLLFAFHANRYRSLSLVVKKEKEKIDSIYAKINEAISNVISKTTPQKGKSIPESDQTELANYKETVAKFTSIPAQLTESCEKLIPDQQ